MPQYFLQLQLNLKIEIKHFRPNDILSGKKPNYEIFIFILNEIKIIEISCKISKLDILGRLKYFIWFVSFVRRFGVCHSDCRANVKFWSQTESSAKQFNTSCLKIRQNAIETLLKNPKIANIKRLILIDSVIFIFLVVENNLFIKINDKYKPINNQTFPLHWRNTHWRQITCQL